MKEHLESSHYYWNKVIETIKALRHPEQGCPWDLKQTHESLIPYLIEESYELKHAIETHDIDNIKEELGDLLLQILLHGTMAQEKGQFNIDDIAQALDAKMIERHPHVFGSKKLATSEEVEIQWKQIKQQKNNQHSTADTPSKTTDSLTKKETSHSYINEKDLHNSPLIAAYKIGKKSNEIHFDWEDYQQVIYKVEEEWQELKEELTPHRPLDKKAIKEEMGDLLFTLSQLSRHLDINPEEALIDANKKFVTRFGQMNQLIQKENLSLDKMNLSELEHFWQKSKKLLKEKK